MSEEKNKTYRLFSVAKELNVSFNTLADFLTNRGQTVKSDPNQKISSDQYDLLTKEFATDKKLKEKTPPAKTVQKEMRFGRDAERSDESDALTPLSPEDLKTKVLDPVNKLEALGSAPKEKALRLDSLQLPRVEPIVEKSAPKAEESGSQTPEVLPAAETVKAPEKKTSAEILLELKAQTQKSKPEPLVEMKPAAEIVEPKEENKTIPTVPKPKIDLTQFAKKSKSEQIREAEALKRKQDEQRRKDEQKRRDDEQKRRSDQLKRLEEQKRLVDKERQRLEQIRLAEEARKRELEETKRKVAQLTERPEILDKPQPPVVEQPTPVAETQPTAEAPVENPIAEAVEESVIRARDNAPKLQGLKVLGKIELPDPRTIKQREQAEAEKRRLEKLKGKDAVYTAKPNDPNAPANESEEAKRKRKRKRKRSGGTNPQQPNAQQPNTQQNNQGANNRNNANAGGGANNKNGVRTGTGNNGRGAPRITEKETNTQLRSTLSEMNKTGSRKRQINRRDKRSNRAAQREAADLARMDEANILDVTEFLTANELANLMDVSVNQVIGKCMEAGLFVSINQRIDRDVIELIAGEFGYDVRFISLEESYIQEEEEEDPELLITRPPIVTVMGHVDHGKTSLLDYIRRTNVIAGEAGGITQHIGAYEVEVKEGKKIAFLDTPGHEAFTAMRARGAQVTDIAIIVIAADDQVMPQTREAINHAQAAGVPMIFAINKVDKPGADSQRIREQLAQMNLLVEDWGGKYQCQEISAKFGLNVELLLEKVLLEAEMLDLKANPDKRARGTVIEAQLDKGRGVVSTILVQSGTLKIGDIILANTHHGRIKAMLNERNQRIKEAGPSTPVQILGLDGVPNAGDKFQVMETEREARELAAKRQQLVREQSLRMQKHITLEEIARRSASGDFRELNVIIKADVDGSAEALADSLIKLSTNEVVVKIVMKGVGQISESDVLLASASNAIIVGFQVRPSPSARKLAQQEQIDLRFYSIIYNAISEIKDALEGLLSPEIKETIQGTVEVREIFRISKLGTIAGCMVTEGKITRQAPIRIIRDGIVFYTGRISSLKRFKDDAKEVAEGYECGISIESFNDLREGDIFESFTTQEVKRTLEQSNH